MKIKNLAGAPIEVFWVNVFNPARDLVKQTEKPIRNATDTQINSYNGHEFLVKFYKGNNKQTGGFVKGPKEETIYVSYDKKRGFRIKQQTKFDEMKENIKGATSLCENQPSGEFSECVANVLNEDIEKLSDAKDEISKYRNLMASRLRNYTCADPTMNSTAPIESTKMVVGDKRYKIDSLFESSHAHIWSIEDFVSPEECAALEKFGRPRLRRATVAAEDGTSTVSESRKAQQAGYKNMRDFPDDPLWDLYHRVLHVTNKKTGFRLQPDGQEDFTIIQYNPTDQYTPHCDGNCDHSPHIPGGRVATAVMYCKVADAGGGTTFTKADVFVKPKPGMATFFSYRGPDGLMDPGYTEHSGCPVIEGEKVITTFWMRDGVSKENPWTVFDPSGVPIFEDNIETISVGMSGDEL
eukprot:CAMPEP_0182437292 /NCGR_PEP_ID=MMETSP1167-20130531/84947_1 /TAXON_ID=2988 /ORGANISM="Mallomonas Sp, Strain CCMP3275" /LENGTH=408 /DNA_ID=CAMNT_0024630157 /DNA_START=151 /DNA_END=1377 /DNA_ORIENTATION=+